MCLVSKPKIPKPAPPPPPAPVLDQVAPGFTDEKSNDLRKRKSGSKKYRAGGGLSIPTNSSASTGGLSITGGT